jgi:hypothetical protein
MELHGAIYTLDRTHTLCALCITHVSVAVATLWLKGVHCTLLFAGAHEYCSYLEEPDFACFPEHTRCTVL